MTALIAGGGLGGLTAALCLAAKGRHVRVFEQAGAFAEAGAGVQLSPNCVHVLHGLGLAAGLRAAACLPEAVEFRHWRKGGMIARLALGAAAAARYGAPYYHIHRGDLLGLLLDAAQRTPAIALHVGTRVERFVDGGEPLTREPAGASPQAAAGAALVPRTPPSLTSRRRWGSGLVAVQTNRGEWQGDLLIGADGIHSTVQQQLWEGAQPEFTGCVAWRALVPAALLPPALLRPVASVWWGPGRHLVHYPVRRGTLVNCVWVVEKQGWEKESWTEPGSLTELKADFAGWHKDIAALLDQVDESSLYKWALFDRRPLPSWGQGRVTLLGDACHPSLPFMAQGAAMALEDAAALANCLQASKDVPSALQRYAALRRPRTARVQRASRRMARIYHLAGPAAWLRNRAAGLAARRIQHTLHTHNPLEAR